MRVKARVTARVRKREGRGERESVCVCVCEYVVPVYKQTAYSIGFSMIMCS